MKLVAIIFTMACLSCQVTDSQDFPIPPVGDDTSQVLWVHTTDQKSTEAILYLLEKAEGNWFAADSFQVVLGRNGMATNKQEGDGCSPAGVYPLLFAFGYAEGIETGMPYRVMGSDDICVDEASHSAYNQHIQADSTSDFSHEKMKRNDHLYEFGIWVGYNTDPVVEGKGSCIFLHVWKDSRTPTAGCTAMDRDDIIRLLKKLDPKRHPVLWQETGT